MMSASNLGTAQAPRALYSNGVARRTPNAGTVQFDLAVNPLSMVMLNFRPINSTGTLSNYASAFAAFAGGLTTIQVLYRGEMIKNFSGGDLLAYNWYRWGILPWEAMPLDTTAYQRSISVPLIFGKNAYDPSSCFPATHRGELILQITFATSGTGWATPDFSADFLELIGAVPTEYEKNITQNITYVATGDQDVDFAIGNTYRNILGFGTTAYNTATPAATLQKLKVLLGNVEQHYTAIDFETANVLSMLWGRQAPMLDHQHRTDTSGASATAQTFGAYTNEGGTLRNYAWIDFDPTKDDTYSLDTSGANRFHIRTTVGTANAARWIPTEVIEVVGGSAA